MRKSAWGRPVAVVARLARHPGYLRPVLRWYSNVLRQRIRQRLRLRPETPREFAMRLMSTSTPHDSATSTSTSASAEQPNTSAPPRTRLLLVIRHGQSTFNVEGRLPGQLPGIPLTDEGRRQAHRAAVALSAIPLSAIIASPLERAAETAAIIARGWGLAVRDDPRLMDTNVGHWSGQKIDEVAKNDPAWKAFVANPDEPPAGVESFSQVQARAVAVAQEALADPESGDYIALVAHGDVVKLILAYYMKTPIPCVPYLMVSNASISGLAFTGDAPPQILATNWTSDPRWLTPPVAPAPPTPEAPEASKAPEGDSTDHADSA